MKKSLFMDGNWFTHFYLKKLLLKMKLTIALIIFVGMMGVQASAFSQSAKLDLNLKNTSVREILKKIEDQTKFSFMFDNSKIDVDYKQSLSLKDCTVNEILDQVFEGRNINYQIIDKHIILMRSKIINQNGTVKITGQVMDEDGVTLPGVSVMIKGTTIGITTDVEGKFTLNIPQDAKTLVFSFVGMKSKEVAIEGQTSFNITLETESIGLEEVVAVGYGTMEKRVLTSSITSIKDKDLIQGVSSSPLAAIQGKVTGLSVISTNGTDPNSPISVQLRGVNSIHASQGPLIVIDGVPGGDINTIAREDIQSIDVLKDASAGAIYGTRASGGVILVTTKKAKAGPARISYTGEFSTETIRKKAEVLSPEEFVANKRGTDFGHKTNWFNEVTRDLPLTQRHVVTVSGGSKAVKVYASAYHKDAKGIAIGSSRKETGGRINFDFRALDDKLNIIGHANYTNIDADVTSNGIFNMALKLNPTQTPYDKNHVTGLNIWKGGYEYYNPVADIRLREDKKKYERLLADITFKYQLTNDLSVSMMAATNQNSSNPTYWRSRYHKSSQDDGVRGHAKHSYSRNTSSTLDWLINYNKEFGEHRIKAVAGHSYQVFDGQGFHASNTDFPVDGIKGWDLNSGTYLSEGRAGMGSYKNPTEKLAAFFGRVNYSWQDKYLFSGSLRYEGSSKFAKGNRWGLFPAVSVGWRLSEETFMQDISFISDLKLRAGYGKTGNEGFGSGVGTRMYKSDTWWLVNGVWMKTYGLAHNPNPQLQWETKTEVNIGVDFSLFKGKLTGKIDAYRRTSDNLIYSISVSQPPAIHDKTTMNVGSLENKGIEGELTWNAVDKGDFNYSTTVKLSHNKNTLKSLWGNQTYWDRKGFPAPGSPGSAVRLSPGEQIGKFYIWKFAGFTKEGNWMLYDKDGKAFDVTKRAKTNDDKRHMGNAIPKLRMAWENSFSYKNFDMSLYFRGWFFYDVYNMTNMYYGLANVKGQNVLRDAYHKNKHIKGEKELTDYWIEKGDFLKLDAVTLGYTLPKGLLGKHIRNARFYLTAKDIFTLTGYSGLDPQININGLEPGFEELNVYPKTTSFTFGVQVQF
ncbi:SusC/RagA family TonB-linked outer membrane protein [Prolixibacteraceae bacterium JC049]|nr:SusC/RagA family TonB-linked outer membrane protein [Prolixibacteraceae bacterium JC049]